MIIKLIAGGKVRTNNLEKIKTIARGKLEICPNSFCRNGLLNKVDDYFECNECKEKFCFTCQERIIISSTHECKEEILESINFIKSIVKCPKCTLPIERSEGCNNMTCSSCSTNFDYVTGESTSHGSHNEKIILNDNNKYVLSNSLLNKYDDEIIYLIQKIESEEPKENKSYINKLKEMILDDEPSTTFSKTYEKYKLHIIEINNYFQLVRKIIKFDKDNKLTKRKLEKIISKITN